MIKELDVEATRLNISRQAVIKTMVSRELEAYVHTRAKKAAGK